MRFNSMFIAWPIASAFIMLSLLLPHVLHSERWAPHDALAAALNLTPSSAGTASYPRGWNIVAGPSGTSFPQANSILYTSQGGGGYTVLINTQGVAEGWGYWACFPSDAMVAISGTGSASYTTTLEPGQMKMVGNPSGLKSATVTADKIYTYDPASGYSMYFGSTTLPVGTGAWVYSSQGGTVAVTATDISAPTPTPPLTATPTPTATATPTSAAAPVPTVTTPPAPTPVQTPPPTQTPSETPTPGPTSEGPLSVTASVSDPNPRQRTQVTVYGQLVAGGQGVAGAMMRTVWNYKSTTSECSAGPTGADGRASCSRDIGAASIGYAVRIEVIFTYAGQTYRGETSFTPVR